MKVQESLGVLSDRRFAWYFTARTVSTAGSVMVPVALAFAVLHIDQSAGGARPGARRAHPDDGRLPPRRWRRRRPLLADRRAPGLARADLPDPGARGRTSSSAGDATLTQLTVIEGVNGAVSAFTMPAMMGIVPLVVDRSRLQQANALLSFSRSGLSIIGPAVAGLLVVGVGPGLGARRRRPDVCRRHRLPDARRSAPAVAGGRRARATRWSASCAEGWSEFTRREWLWVIVLAFGLTNAIHAGVIGVLGPLIAESTASIGEAGWGLVLSAEAVGTVLMTLVMLRLQLRRPLRAGMLAICVLAVPMVLLGRRAGDRARRHRLLPRRRRRRGLRRRVEHGPARARPRPVLSRVSSYDALGSFVAIPIGTFLYGWLATTVDTEVLMLVSAGVYVVISLSALLSAVRA